MSDAITPCVLRIPLYDQWVESFIYTMANSDEVDDLFDNLVVKALIEFLFDVYGRPAATVSRRIHYFALLVQVLRTVVFMLLFIEPFSEENCLNCIELSQIFSIVLGACIIFPGIIILSREAYQFKESLRGKHHTLKFSVLRYFSSGWNVLDLICGFGCVGSGVHSIIMAASNLGSPAWTPLDRTTADIESLLAFMLWGRTVFFLRADKDGGFFVQMIIQIIKDAKVFLFVLSLNFFAQVHAYFALTRTARSMDPDEPDFPPRVREYWDIPLKFSAIYRLVALGDFSDDDWERQNWLVLKKNFLKENFRVITYISPGSGCVSKNISVGYPDFVLACVR